MPEIPCLELYITFCFTIQKFPIIMRNLEKCPECLQRFHVEWQGKSSQKGISNLFDFESPDSVISRFPMTLMRSMASLPSVLNM
jgi:hypothetical protein